MAPETAHPTAPLNGASAAPLGQEGTGPLLRPRREGGAAAALRASAALTAPEDAAPEDVLAWLSRRADQGGFSVRPVPFAEADGWHLRADTGDLVHRSGGFFTVEGLHVRADSGEEAAEWHQPIINQPEIGVLGILAQRRGGVLRFLMQAKMEPGNRNLVQLSPTVQATRSNYTGVHGGRAVRYLEYFMGPRRGRVLADVLQSEHGSWFLRKVNRNMLVEVDPGADVPEHEDFRWVPLGALGRLLRHDNAVNMDARTVLAGAPVPEGADRALHDDTALLSWFTGERTRHRVRTRTVPLKSIPHWVREEDRIRHEAGRYFEVVTVAVEAGTREVARWCQPLLRPCGLGVTAFLLRRFGGVPHVLVHARPEGGLMDGVELAPTVQCTPANYAHLPAPPPFLDAVLAAPPERVRYAAVHSEEGGRFLHAESRYLVVEADEATAPLAEPAGYRWVSLDQLHALVRHTRYVNVQARTLLACFACGAVDL
ncbi:NDP-hexose 2,3-dehydratase family protein [Streptomonospora nanhaiensis]|uniref:NDP-hexose 2,3-dehydratase family protein n=1 Tax=Streptomonospora nanhaiensis TaxID=1323731 RepID=UPI001C99C9B2|nr:NDP-hexose 2,3-dehydratase family protein [Streptomonospora nanhaiensis]MBX9390064.1 NDP-hexose 2,3-dehydratase family protein [Streptomonospora nanhaiensis]